VREDFGPELKCAKFWGHVCEGVDNRLEAACAHAPHGGQLRLPDGSLKTWTAIGYAET
jgi:hypothetical protein